MTLKNFLTGSFLLWSTFLSGQNTILWKVTNTSNKNISYLLGTYHLFGNSFIDSFPVLKETILASDLIITETKIDREKMTEYYNSRPASDTLSTSLSKEDVDLIADIFKKGQVDIKKLTPGELFLKLQAGYPKFKCSVINKSDKWSMDEYIQYLGNQHQKKSYYLETDSFQLEKLTQITNAYNWTFFKKNIHPLLNKYRGERPNENLCLQANQYASFTLDYKFGEACDVLLKGTGMNDALVKKRNEDWMQKLPPLLEKNNCFVAVGLAHLYTTCGLIEQLKILGYTIEPVTLK
jgi:uncharacterized protein